MKAWYASIPDLKPMLSRKKLKIVVRTELQTFQKTELLMYFAESLGDGVEKNLEEKVEEDKEQKTDNADEDEEEQLLDAMKKELKADKVGLEETPTIEKKWK